MRTLKKPYPNLDKSKDENVVPVLKHSSKALTQSTKLVCEIIEIAKDGYPMIKYEEKIVRADSLVDINEQCVGQRCLAMVPDNNQNTPVILGLLWQPNEVEELDESSNKVIESSESISLNCGKSSLTLEANGTVRLQGVTLTSQAYGSNRIKGAAVKIN